MDEDAAPALPQPAAQPEQTPAFDSLPDEDQASTIGSPPASAEGLVELRDAQPGSASGAGNWWTPASGDPDADDPEGEPPRAETPEAAAYPGLPAYEPVAEHKGRRFAIREVLETVVLALLIFVAVQGVVQNFRVEGTSMDPSLKNEERLLVNKGVYMRIDLDILSKFVPFIDFGDTPKRYIFHGPERGDVIVFEYPNDPTRDFIKRVMGLPGDWVEIRKGVVYINGERIREPYIKNKALYDYGPEQVPPDNYFVLGDNRPNSSDSHVWGFVPADNIIGKAWVTYWPADEAGLAPNQDLSIATR